MKFRHFQQKFALNSEQHTACRGMENNLSETVTEGEAIDAYLG
jgi:hypothetical protein